MRVTHRVTGRADLPVACEHVFPFPNRTVVKGDVFPARNLLLRPARAQCQLTQPTNQPANQPTNQSTTVVNHVTNYTTPPYLIGGRVSTQPGMTVGTLTGKFHGIPIHARGRACAQTTRNRHKDISNVFLVQQQSQAKVETNACTNRYTWGQRTRQITLNNSFLRGA